MGGDILEKVAQGGVDAPSLEAFKARLDVALVWWLATLHIAGGLELDDHLVSTPLLCAGLPTTRPEPHPAWP